MSLAREEYDERWRRAPHVSRGPVSWRSAHHRPADLQLLAVGAAADRAGLRLELSVRAGEPVEAEDGGAYRRLHRLILVRDSEPVVIVDVTRSGSLVNAARICLERLGKLAA